VDESIGTWIANFYSLCQPAASIKIESSQLVSLGPGVVGVSVGQGRTATTFAVNTTVTTWRQIQ